ncbi:E3 ubiquitin-protein ligase ATL6 [Glycine max]|nr:E3 ubiquitin-protein ligase ATL6 [Glycine max]
MKFIVLFFLLASSSSYSYAQSPIALVVAHVPSTRAMLPMLLALPQATRVLAACPVTSYSAIKMRTPQNPVFQCAVCLAEFNDADDALHLLPKCGHVFHAHCIDA